MGVELEGDCFSRLALPNSFNGFDDNGREEGEVALNPGNGDAEGRHTGRRVRDVVG